MSRRFEKVTRQVEYTQLVERHCDLCGRQAEANGDWETGYYKVNETEVKVEVRHKEGSQCSDGGSGTETVIDICPHCFKNVLVPFLQSKGASIETKDWDW